MDIMYPQHSAAFHPGAGTAPTWEAYQHQEAQFNASQQQQQNDFLELMRRQFEMTTLKLREAQVQAQEVPQIMTDDQAQYASMYGYPYLSGVSPALSAATLNINTNVPSVGSLSSGLSSSPHEQLSPNLSATGAFPTQGSPGMLQMPVNPYSPYGQPGYSSPMHSLPGTPLPTNGLLPTEHNGQQGFPGMMANNAGMTMNPNNGSPLTRTVYVGNLPADAAVDELLSLVRFGPIESVKILPERSCAFISFLEPTIASAFHSDVLMRKIQLHGQELRVGWGKPSPLNSTVLAGVQNFNACRNVFVGNLDEHTTEQSLRDDLSRFGPIDQVKIVRDKNIGFIHFLSIGTAMKVVETLPREPGWHDKRVNYGKDRCAYVPKNQHQQQQHNLQAAALAANYTGNIGALSASMNPMGLMTPMMAQSGMENSVLFQAGNRTIYLGNLHPETSVEEICNCIRGGVLQQIRYIREKHICFVTFVDPNAALAFISSALAQGLTIHTRRIKIGYGKHSGPAPAGIALCVQAGGSRNVYIGGIDDFEVFNADKLRADFGQYGTIELTNCLRDKNCAFVNFTDIANAIKAIEGMKHNPEYTSFKIAYGKDRCGNPPRPFNYRRNSNRQSTDGDKSGEMEAPCAVSADEIDASDA